MEYEIVELKEKKVAGIEAKTNNFSPDMSRIIGGLWEKFYSGIYQKFESKSNDKALGIYTDYSSDFTGDYTVMVGYEINSYNKPDGTVMRTIPGGKYAKFAVRGNMITAVAEFWQKLWNMDLPRSYLCDFEEYQNGDTENAEIHIYIGLK